MAGIIEVDIELKRDNISTEGPGSGARRVYKVCIQCTIRVPLRVG
jgi:hypothetical protein